MDYLQHLNMAYIITEMSTTRMLANENFELYILAKKIAFYKSVFLKSVFQRCRLSLKCI